MASIERVTLPPKDQKRTSKVVTRSSGQKKKRRVKCALSAKALKRNRDAMKNKSPAISSHDRVVNQLGMFRVFNHESQDSIAQAIESCSTTSKYLVIPSCLIRAFDGDAYKAAVMSFLLYMEGKLSKGEYPWFVVKYPEVERFTGAKRKRIVGIMQYFRDAGLIRTQMKCIPAMQHYIIDKDMLIQLCMERVLNYKDPLLELGIAEVVR